MTSQTDIFDYAAEMSRSARTAGMRRAVTGSSVDFDLVVEAIRGAAACGEDFSSDDCLIDARDGQVGAAFRYLAERGEIVAVGFTASRRQASHGRWIRSWRRSA